jgi:hypothetical protein
LASSEWMTFFHQVGAFCCNIPNSLHGKIK